MLPLRSRENFMEEFIFNLLPSGDPIDIFDVESFFYRYVASFF